MVSPSMYPQSTGNIQIILHPKVWQAHHNYGAKIFVEADTEDEALQKIRKIFVSMDLDLVTSKRYESTFQYRQVPLYEPRSE